MRSADSESLNCLSSELRRPRNIGRRSKSTEMNSNFYSKISLEN